MFRRRACLVAALLSVQWPVVASATCQPLASLPLERLADGLMALPARIDGHAAKLAVDTGGSLGIIDERRANDFGLSIGARRRNIGSFYGGDPIERRTYVESLELGSLPPMSRKFAIANPGGIAKGADGMLGADVLSRYDIGIDFAAGALQLYSSGQCATGPNWASADSAVPMRAEQGDHIAIAVRLDDAELTAIVDTGAQKTTLTLQAARNLTRDRTGQDLKAVSQTSINGAPMRPVFFYPFHVLKIGKVELRDPPVEIVERSSPPMLIGLDILSHMRLLVSYRDRRLYLAVVEERTPRAP